MNIADWESVGRGQEITFFATDQEIVSVLQEGLPNEYSPYTLLAFLLIKEDEIGYRYSISEDDIQAFPQYHMDGVIVFYIRSHKLIPELPDYHTIDIRHWLNIHGVIQLNASYYQTINGWWPSDIGMVTKHRNRITGELIQHKEYASIYKRLKHAFQAIMKATVLMGEGEFEQEIKNYYMSQGSIDEYHAGKRLIGRPGKAL